MVKKVYVAPDAEYMLFAPAEEVANSNWNWQWQWGEWSLLNEVTVSAQGTNQLWLNPWEWDNNGLPQDTNSTG